jgi:chromosome segregation ATPase
MTVLNNRIVKLSTRKNTYSLYSDKQSELQDRIQELELEVADAEILNSLVAAYSGKGLRNVALQHVATVLQDNLNTFSGLLYGEDIKFQIISTESGVSAKAIRGKDSVSDIRMLSGSESDAFSLIFLLSILSLTPSNRRSNFVVLDEMDSHMDDAMRTRFYTGYLATLKTVIPNIFVITPRDTGLPDVKFDKVVRVIKQNGTSKVLSKVYK